MATALNEHCFFEPYWRVIASGFQTEAVGIPSQVNQIQQLYIPRLYKRGAGRASCFWNLPLNGVARLRDRERQF